MTPWTMAKGDMVADKGRKYSPDATGLATFTDWNQLGLGNIPLQIIEEEERNVSYK